MDASASHIMRPPGLAVIFPAIFSRGTNCSEIWWLLRGRCGWHEEGGAANRGHEEGWTQSRRGRKRNG